MSCIPLELLVEDAILLELAPDRGFCLDAVLTGPRGLPGQIQAEEDPLFTLWRGLFLLEGERHTGADPGMKGALSVADDYLYVCVTGGEAGVAVWKKALLFQT